MAASQIIRKLRTINPWHFIWITVVFSEVFTLAANSIQSYLRWGFVSHDLLSIGCVDALFVPLVVAPVIMYFLMRTQEITGTNERLLKELG